MYRSKNHALGNLERMRSVINKIGLQPPLRTTSSNCPPQGNNKIKYCSGPKKIIAHPLKKQFSQFFFFFFGMFHSAKKIYNIIHQKNNKIFFAIGCSFLLISENILEAAIEIQFLIDFFN